MTRPRTMAALAALAALAGAAGACTLAPQGRVEASGQPIAVEVALVGDMAPKRPGSNQGDDKVANMIVADNPDLVVALGDLQYDNGTLAQFKASYDLSYGRLADRTLPVVGNHEYRTPHALGFFDYWRSEGVDPDGDGILGVPEFGVPGAYRTELGAGWVLFVLNGECGREPCGPNSRQATWLASQLASLGAGQRGIVATHRPRWSSGEHGDYAQLDPLWDVAIDSGKVCLWLAGHEHEYQRRFDEGLPTIISGTGGGALDPLHAPDAETQAVISGEWGYTRLVLGADGTYTTMFVGVDADAPTDATLAYCQVAG